MADDQPSDAPQAFKRRSMANYFDHARKHMAQDGYDHDYATDLLSQCVIGDFATVDYLETFLLNLHRKYNNNRRGNWLAMLSGAGARSSMKKAATQKDWAGVIKQAVELLKLNPWDSNALSTLATVAERLGPDYDKVELKCLKSALDARPKDPEVNRQCARALARRGEFDQAIACLHRVEKARPHDDDVRREISQLTVRKQQARSGGATEEAAAPRSSAAEKSAPGQPAAAAADGSPEQRLKRQIVQEPQNVSLYLELAELYRKADRHAEAEPVLAKAFELSGGQPEIREQLYDAQAAVLKRRIAAAEKKASGGDDQAKQDWRRLRKKLALKELEIFKFRCDRYPTNLIFKFELGCGYQAVGDYQEAIKQFQAARADPRRKGSCLLHLGQCFQQIKQLRLAMSHFEQAVAEIPDREQDDKKLSLYLAGRVAMALGDKEGARKYLTDLAQMDFGYKDVASQLDKLEQMGTDEPQAEEAPKEEGREEEDR